MTKKEVQAEIVRLSRELREGREQVAVRLGIVVSVVDDTQHPELAAIRAELRELKKLRKEIQRERRNRRKRNKRARGGGVVRVKVTRTVQYRYDPADNQRLEAFYASREWRMLRYEALRRDGGRCRACGDSAADGARLNVDHIKPLRAFWHLRLELSNLQVLCESCNEGKGARHADDWR